MARIGDASVGDVGAVARALTADQVRVLAALADRLLDEETDAAQRQAAIDAHPLGRGAVGIAGDSSLLADKGPDGVIDARLAEIEAEAAQLRAIRDLEPMAPSVVGSLVPPIEPPGPIEPPPPIE